MAYTSPPTFSSGATLTSSQLNILAADIEYINGLTDYINLPFGVYTYAIGGAQSMAEQEWFIRHRHQYLHYYLTIDESTITANLHLDVNWAGTWRTVKSYSSGLAAGAVKDDKVDLTGNDTGGSPLNIPNGALMRVRWDAVANGRATARYILESAFATIV